MSNKLPQHVQCLNQKPEDHLTPQDLLVYTAVKRHMNHHTYSCYPSLRTISKESGVGIKSIKKSLDRLQSLQYISITKSNGHNVYTFNSIKTFEPFSYTFLDKENLTTLEKAYIIAAQRYMLVNNQSEGVIKLSDRELADKINMPKSSISRIEQSLQTKGFVLRDGSNKAFNLTALDQAFIFVLRNHEDRLLDIEADYEKTKRENEELKKQKAEDTKTIARLNNKIRNMENAVADDEWWIKTAN